jgi:hypothetical protein
MKMSEQKDKQTQVERENLDLGERYYRVIPDKGKPKRGWIDKGKYKFYLNYIERLSYPDEDKAKDPVFIQEGALGLESNYGGNFPDFHFCEEYVYSSMWGSHMKPRFYNLSDTRKVAQEFGKKTHEHLKSKNLWIDPKKLTDFVYEALSPVRQRRKELSEIVMGVDFGEEI